MKARLAVLLASRFLGIGASRSLSNARKSLIGAALGIGISLVPLVIVLVVSDGMIEGITRRIITLGTSHIQVVNYSASGGSAPSAAWLRELADDIVYRDSSGSITGAWGERQGTGIAIGPAGRNGAVIRAVDAGFFRDNTAALDLITVIDGDISSLDGTTVFIGKKLSEKTGLGAGDRLRLITLQDDPAGGSPRPRVWTYTVGAVITSGYQELDALWLFLPLEQGFRILGESSARTLINVFVDNPFGNLVPVLQGIYHRLPTWWSVYAWPDLNRSQFQSFRTTKLLLLFIMMLIVFVASINVSSALVMLVMERRREIAILKSTGTDPSTISAAFVLAGFMTGFAGLLTGLPAGILLSLHINSIFTKMENGLNVARSFFWRLTGQGSEPLAIHLLDPEYYLEHIPVVLSVSDLYIISCGTLILSVLVSMIPAWRAGTEKPLDTLRKI